MLMLDEGEMHKKGNMFSPRIGERGAAVVELVIVLPLLVLLVAGTVELGVAFFQWNTLTKAVQDGTRYLADNARVALSGQIDVTDTNNNVWTRTQTLITYGSPDTGNPGTPLFADANTNLTISNPVVATTGPLNHVTITASYAHNVRLAAMFLGNALPATLTLAATSTMRIR